MGERLNISLDKGVHRTPTIGEEGQLSECVNMIPRNGQLTPLRAPSEHYHYTSDRYHLLYIHENAGYKHYIHAVKLADNLFKLYWSDDDPAGEIGVGDMTELTGITVGSLENIYHISHIGNTVIFLTDSGVKMQVFKGNAYKYLSGQIPELNISFGLKTWLDTQNTNRVGTGISPVNALYWIETDYNLQYIDYQVEISEVIKPKRNSMIRTAHEEGYWTFPFLVRYALIMTDGTVVHCSAPVLMTPAENNPLVSYKNWHVNNEPNTINLVKAKLDMMIDSSEVDALKDYKDIISKVAIYVSEQFWTYDQDANYTKGRNAFPTGVVDFHPLTYYGGKSYGKFQEARSAVSGMGLAYEPSTIADLMYYKLTGDSSVLTAILQSGSVLYENPRKGDVTLNDEISSCSNYYLLREYTLEELSMFTTERTNISFTDGRLANISSYARLNDESELRENIVPIVGYTYNQRLNISRISATQTNPLALSSLINYIEKAGRSNSIGLNNTNITPSVTPGEPSDVSNSSTLFVQTIETNKDGYTSVINNSIGGSGLYNKSFYYIAIPNEYATKIWLYEPDATDNMELPLKKHSFLNVAYYYQGIGDIPVKEEHRIPDESNEPITDNRLHQSLPGNPWVFPNYLRTTVGNGHIIGMAAAIKALSVGQYGQFPLIIFATDGIWTLQVNDDGTYKPATFLSGDVCSNPQSITQTDNAVLFVTKQGLKIVDGSNVILLSKPIEGVDIPDSTFVPMGTGDIASRWAGILVDDTTDRRLSLQDCKCLFDYTDSLLHIFNDTNKHYCLELNGQEFASEVNNVQIWESGYGEAVDTNPFDVAEYDGDYLIFIESDDVEISPDGKDGFITDDRLLSTDLRFRWEWSLDHGKLRTKNRTFGGSTRDIIDVVLQVDVSVCDGSDNVLANYSGQFDVHNDGEAIDVPSAEFVIHSDDIHYIDNDGPVKIKFQSLSYIVAVDGTMGEGEYFAPQLSLTTTIGYESASGETHQGKLGKPSRIITRNPESLFQVGTQVFSYAGYDSEAGERLGYLITRPVAFGDFAKYKTILDIRIYDQIIEKGTVSTGNGTWMLLFGSNNERQWYRLNSLHGSSFKFFRLALVTSLGKDDTISGVSIEYEERRGTKMR